METIVPTEPRVYSLSLLQKIEQGLRRRYRHILGLLFKLYLVIHGCKVGRNTTCYSLPRFRVPPNKNIHIGDNVTFGHNCTLEVAPEGEIIIADHANITQNVLIACSKRIFIGRYTMIGENVSVRDANHGISKQQLIALQPMDGEPIHIEDDVWIGAFSMVLKGAHIREGAVIGGKSLVSKSSHIDSYGVYVGSPVKFLKWRS